MKRYLTVPNMDLQLCPIGLGTVNAGLKWDGSEAFRVFDAYLDMGGNVIDTARIYSDWIPPEIGRSERVIGDWLRSSGKRDKVVLMTKGGHPRLQPNSPPRMTPADMRQDLELSLKALGTDVIDIYFYHRDNRAQSIEEEMETMETFRKEGKIRYYGCSNWEADRVLEADRYSRGKGFRGFAADQALLNVGTRYKRHDPQDPMVRIQGPLYDYHVHNPQNLAIAYMSVAGGFFHQYMDRGAEALKDNPYCTSENRRVAKRCMELMEKYHASMTQVLLGFYQQLPFACAALYGPRNGAQVADAMGAMEIPFVPEDFDFLDNHF